MHKNMYFTCRCLAVRTLESIMKEPDACANHRTQQMQHQQLYSEPLPVALSTIVIPDGHPYVVNNPWGSAKPNAIFPQKVPNISF